MKIMGIGNKRDIVIPCDTAAALISLSDGNAVRLFLFAAAEGGEHDKLSAMQTLGLSEGEYRLAVAALEKAGLAEISEPEQKTDFSAALSAAERAVGRMLRRNETESLLAVLESSGMSPGAFAVLLRFVLSRRETFGIGGRSLTVAQICKNTAAWVSEGIYTQADADRYIAARKNLDREVISVRNTLGINITGAYELAVVSGWVEDGFNTESISIAADIASKNGHPSDIAYISKVIRKWKDNGVADPASIRNYQAALERSRAQRETAMARRNGGKKSNGVPTLSAAELASIAETADYLKNGGDNSGI